MTSAGPSEGKTTTVANLAAMFAEADNSVLVINCDFRRPRLHRFLGGSDEPRKVVQSEVEGVRMVNNVLSNPNPNPAEVAAAQRQVVEAARGMFDIVILDTAPLLSTNDASEIMSSADVVVLVSQAGKTSKASAARATEILQRMEATVAGVALLGARYVPSAQYYYYANDNGQNPNRAEAESHPLDLLIRTDTQTNGSSNGSANGRSSAGAGATNGSAATSGPTPDGSDPAAGAAVEPATEDGAFSLGDERCRADGRPDPHRARQTPTTNDPGPPGRSRRPIGSPERLPRAARPAQGGRGSGRLGPPGPARPGWGLLGLLLVLAALALYALGEWVWNRPTGSGLIVAPVMIVGRVLRAPAQDHVGDALRPRGPSAHIARAPVAVRLPAVRIGHRRRGLQP